MRFLRKNHSRIWTCCSWRNLFEMLPEWANLISSYSLSDNLDWSPSPLCRWTEPETNGTFPLLLLLTNIVVKKGGPNFHGSFSFSNWADAKWALAASRTNLRKLDPWTTSFTWSGNSNPWTCGNPQMEFWIMCQEIENATKLCLRWWLRGATLIVSVSR